MLWCLGFLTLVGCYVNSVDFLVLWLCIEYWLLFSGGVFLINLVWVVFKFVAFDVVFGC